jgi:hypothetical protein
MDTFRLRRRARRLTTAAFGVVWLAAGSAHAQAPEPPRPGPEHEVLKLDVGTWDASIELTPVPGEPPMMSKGVETNTLGCAGLCLLTEFRAEFLPGVPFFGHGIGTWDAVKKKYTGAWTDSMSLGLGSSEVSWDPKTRRAEGWVETPEGTSGPTMRLRTVVEHLDDGRRVSTSFVTGPDGKEMQFMRVTYTRRK